MAWGASAWALLTAALLVSCSGAGTDTVHEAPADAAPASAPTATPPPAATSSASAPSPSAGESEAAEPGLPVSDGRPRRAWLTVAGIGVDRLLVVPYQGWTDDAPGTEIQNRGLLASPFGPRGGVGPGGVGNYQVTGHRLSSTRAFEFLPGVRRGARVVVTTTTAQGPVRYVYRVVDTRETSFRSERSLREQRAAVPGRPDAAPTRAMITLSTCATVEDHASGNYWSDQFDNPEHRIDKIGVLVAVRR